MVDILFFNISPQTSNLLSRQISQTILLTRTHIYFILILLYLFIFSFYLFFNFLKIE